MMDSSSMQQDWERRASSSPLYAIDSSRRRWDIEAFYERGPSLVARFVDPALEHLGVDPAGKRVLEIGCGMGRLFAGLRARFGEVWGIDISAGMIERGKASCPVEATWIKGDGRSLTGVEDASVDHVLSYEVLQHIPDPEVIRAYEREVLRVLRPGGTFQLHMRSGSDSRRQAAVRALPRQLRVAAGTVLQRTGVVPVDGDIDTWLGCVISPVEAEATAREIGFCDVACLRDDLHTAGMGYWLVGRRPLQDARSDPERPR